MSSKKTISIAIGLYGCLLLSAVPLRLDYFPLTWVPMYSAHEVKGEYAVKKNNKKDIRKGFAAVQQNGNTKFINHLTLNMPYRNYKLWYRQRIYNTGPPKHRRAIHIYENYGRKNILDINWPKRVLFAVNRNLNLKPQDPEFIVSLSAKADQIVLSNLNNKPITRQAGAWDTAAVWDPAWNSSYLSQNENTLE